MSSMSSLTTALSALYAQRHGLDVTGHNIANANTEGYTRQRVELVAQASGAVGVFSRWNGVGQGVDVAGTQRLNDAFLDLRSLQEHATQGELQMTQQVLGRIELGFGEPSELGLAAQLNDYWAGWDDVANNPTDLAARNALIERATTLTGSLSNTANSLETLKADLTDQLRAQLDSVNNMAGSIAQLNDDIVNATNAGMSPNDLMDQRDLMISKLADVVGITIKPGKGGIVDVFVGGTALVRGNTTEPLQVTVDGTGSAEVSWVKDGYPTAVSGGAAAALLTAINGTIPDYRTKLDAIADELAARTNTIHQAGQDLNGAAGGQFFTGSGALGVEVNAAIRGNPQLVAAADGGGTADGANALKLAALAGIDGGPDRLYRSMIVGLGVQADAVNRRVDIQYEITRQVDAARDAQAGVNLDEEMTNMLMYQRAYEAASRYLTAIDQTLDRLINSTGLVGR